MWTLISGINLAATRRRVARRVVTAAVVVGTGTQVAMALLPNPATRSDRGRLSSSEVCEFPASPDFTVG